MASHADQGTSASANGESLPARLSRLATDWSGSSAAFWMALLVIVLWLLSGPLFGFSDTWQLIINTGTTIVTFLKVFLIQRAQNKDSGQSAGAPAGHI
jgi:low affinity Fe/Cu permease